MGPVGLVQVEEDAHGDECVFFIVFLQHFHSEGCELHHVLLEYLIRGEAIEDLQNRVADRILVVFGELTIVGRKSVRGGTKMEEKEGTWGGIRVVRSSRRHGKRCLRNWENSPVWTISIRSRISATA